MGFVNVENYCLDRETPPYTLVASNATIEGIPGKFEGFDVDGKIYLVLDTDHINLGTDDLEILEHAYRVVRVNEENETAKAAPVKNKKTLEAIAETIKRGYRKLEKFEAESRENIREDLSEVSAEIHERINSGEDRYDAYGKLGE